MNPEEIEKWRRKYRVKPGDLSILEFEASMADPELGKKLERQASERQKAYEKAKRKQEEDVINRGLDLGYSFEDIAEQSGLDPNRVREYAEKSRPGYGVKTLKDKTKGVLDTASDVATGALAGVGRFGAGVMQTAGSVVDYATPGKGSNRLTDLGNKQARELDAIVDMGYANEAVYRGTQVGSEAVLAFANPASALTKIKGGAKVLEGMTKVSTKVDDVLGVVDDIAKANTRFGKVTGGVKAGTKELIDPTNLTNEVILGTRQTLNNLSNSGDPLTTKEVAEGALMSLGGAYGTAMLRGLDARFTKAPPKLQEQVAHNVLNVFRQAENAKQATKQAGKQTAKQASKLTAEGARDRAMQVGKQAAKGTSAKGTPGGGSQEAILQGTGETRVASAAARAESEGIAEGLIKREGNASTYEAVEGGFYNDQANKAQALMDTDWDTSVKMAMGETPVPDGVYPGAMYEAVKYRALQNGDASLFNRLVSESTVPVQEGTEAGRRAAAFGMRDPESPETGLRTIMAARKKHGLPQSLSDDEVKDIMEASTKLAQAKKVALARVDDEAARLEYGRQRVAYDALIAAKSSPQHASRIEAIMAGARAAKQDPMEAVLKVTGLSKTASTTLDAPPLFRQAWKTLATHPTKWVKASRKAIPAYIKAIGKKGELEKIYADVASRPNALNGNYARMKLETYGAIPKVREEQLPESELINKIPLIGRFTRASEAGFAAIEQYTRAELADHYLALAEKAGVDLSNKHEIESIGRLVNSLTNKGAMKQYGQTKQILNNVFFSPAMMKSNFDVLTAHQFNRGGTTAFTRRQARVNMLKIMGTAVSVLGTAKLAQELGLNKDLKVEFDPRSSNFGRIQVKNTRFDVTGGLAPMWTLAARLMTGKTKSSTTGEVRSLNSNDFGAQTGEDVLTTFFANKLAPAATLVRDWKLQGKDFDGNPVTPVSAAKTLMAPLIIRNISELQGRKDAASVLAIFLAEDFGIGTNTYGLESDWNASNGKRVQGFKQKVGQESFNKANKAFDDAFSRWYESVANDDRFWNMSQEARQRLVTSKKDDLTKEIMKTYGYEYKPQKTSDEDKELAETLKKLR